MGLDITAYSKLVERPDLTYNSDDGEFYEADGKSLGWDNHFMHLQDIHKFDFPGRMEGLKDDTVYEYTGERFAFRAGSYGGYNLWRRALAKFAGHGTPEKVWEQGEEASGPFVELISFSDCEGCIGPVVAAKLLKDFDEFAPKLQSLDRDELGIDLDYFKDLYESWHQAFKVAADGGVVDFH